MPSPYQPKGIHTANMPDAEIRVSRESSVRPFITIAQQVGAECAWLPRRLTEALNEASAHAPDWSHWNEELIGKVSTGCQVPAELIKSFDTAGHSWVDDILCGISGRTDELVVFHRLKEAVREFAHPGHAVLVGNGSTYMTRDLPAGMHVRLIAPMIFRIKSMAARSNLSAQHAARRVRRLDKRRRAFFARYWPGRPLVSEMFTAVFNVAELEEERLIRAIVALLPEQ